MPADDMLDEIVVFEVPCRTRAEGLCGRLRPRWHAELYDCAEVVLVAAELRPRADDLAVLLQAAKLWALDSALALMRFHLDGRSYVLDSGLGLLEPTTA
jgi:hypothetical protein